MPTSNRREFVQQIASAALAAPLIGSSAFAAKGEKPRIKVGQIGVGHAHASKLGVYRKSPDYEVVGIVESDPGLREQAEKNPLYQELPWMTRDELLTVDGLQAVLVETEVRDLLNNAEACVAAGKHIHLDKPAGESLPQLRKILADAKRRKLIVQMGYMFRYNPGVVMLREFLAHGWLGEVFEVNAVMGKVVPPASRQELAAYPGGIMFELGCHVMDLVIAILGKPDRVTGFNHRSGKFDDNLVDNMLAVLDYPGATATIRSSAIDVEGGARRQLTVCGTKGTFHIQPLDDPAVWLTLSEPRGDFKAGVQTVALPKYSRYIDDAADMAQAIRGEKDFGFSYEHDLAVQTALLEACGLPVE
jgi:predicted dehydrogenase